MRKLTAALLCLVTLFVCMVITFNGCAQTNYTGQSYRFATPTGGLGDKQDTTVFVPKPPGTIVWGNSYKHYYVGLDGFFHLFGGSSGGITGTLTSPRIPFANSASVLMDNANFTYNSTFVTVPALNATSLTDHRVTTAGPSGRLTDFAELTYSSGVNVGVLTVGNNAASGGAIASGISIGSAPQSITATDGTLPFSVSQQAQNGAGLFTISGGDAISGSGGGGAVTIKSGNGFGTGAGGNMTVIAGSSISGIGGTLSIGGASSTNGAGGAMNINSGNAGGANGGGALTIRSGSSISGLGGDINILSATATTNTAGSINITAGLASGAGAGGNVTITSGTTSGGTGGNINLVGSANNKVFANVSGSLQPVLTGNQTTTRIPFSTSGNQMTDDSQIRVVNDGSAGTNLFHSFQVGIGQPVVDGSSFDIARTSAGTFAISAAQGTTTGNDIQIAASRANSGNSNGGNVVLFTGLKAGTGLNGMAIIQSSSGAGYLRIINIPTSSAGLPSGTVWSNAGVLNIVP